MSPESAESIVCWTARVVVAVYLVRLVWDVRDRHRSGAADASGGRRSGLTARRMMILWTAGCLVHLLHVAAAMGLIHDWSHAAAYADTARQTAAVTGWDWGGGLWINYAFTLWWPLDVAWTWRRGIRNLPGGYVLGLHLVVGFLLVNATVVFGPPWWKWLAGILAGLAGLAALRTRWKRRISPKNVV